LRGLGHADEAAKAERMHNLMAPRPAARSPRMAAAPDADVLLVAHEGLEDLSSVADLWRGCRWTTWSRWRGGTCPRTSCPGQAGRRSGRLAVRLVGTARRLGRRAATA
jgi:hypothetical protein